MSDKHKPDHQKPIDEWLDQDSDKPMSEQLAQFLAQDIKTPVDSDEESQANKQWQQRVHTANYVAHQASINQEQEVPNWNAGDIFDQHAKANTPWWQWQGLPIVSTAFSCFAIALVLLNVQFTVGDNGVLLSFGGQAQQAQEKQLAALVDQRLQTFASEQQVVLANYVADIKAEQQQNNLQLANYVFSTSRQERKDDISELIRFIVEDRKDSQLNQKIRYNQLEEKINRVSFQHTSGQDVGRATTTPVDWDVEE